MFNCGSEGWILGLFQSLLCDAIDFFFLQSQQSYTQVGWQFPWKWLAVLFIYTQRVYLVLVFVFSLSFLIIWLYYSFSMLWRY